MTRCPISILTTEMRYLFFLCMKVVRHLYDSKKSEIFGKKIEIRKRERKKKKEQKGEKERQQERLIKKKNKREIKGKGV